LEILNNEEPIGIILSTMLIEKKPRKLEERGKCMLALDQVLEKLWSVLAQFWTLTCYSKKEHLGGAKIMDLTDFEGYVDPVKVPLGFCNGFMGCRPMGFSHV
jgi:hypothetical protein